MPNKIKKNKSMNFTRIGQKVVMALENHCLYIELSGVLSEDTIVLNALTPGVIRDKHL